MKSLRAIIGGALALSVQVSPVSASPASPAVTLTKLAPVSAAIVTPACNRDAAVNGTAYWEKPQIADQQGVAGTARIEIRLDRDGKLARESVASSSGNRWLDEAALMSARMTRFSPELVDCKPVAGAYMYDVEF